MDFLETLDLVIETQLEASVSLNPPATLEIMQQPLEIDLIVTESLSVSVNLFSEVL